MRLSFVRSKESRQRKDRPTGAPACRERLRRCPRRLPAPGGERNSRYALKQALAVSPAAVYAARRSRRGLAPLIPIPHGYRSIELVIASEAKQSMFLKKFKNWIASSLPATLRSRLKVFSQ